MAVTTTAATWLRLLALRRRRQRNDPKHARTDSFGQGLDRASLARSVAPFENDADLQPLMLHPFLQFHQFDLQAEECFVVFFSL